MSAAFRLLLLAAATAPLLGCQTGPAACYIEGRATCRGRPVSEYHVVFYSPSTGGGASAVLDESGAFRVAGAVQPGEYVVTVVLPAPPPSAAPRSARKPAVAVSGAYQSEKTTDLKVNVVAGENRFDFDLRP